MRIPSPYFKDVPMYGNLDMEQIIVDYDYPLLSVLKDLFGRRYLCMCFDTRGAQQWLITPITGTDLTALLQNKMTLDAPFLICTTQKILATLNYETRVETFELVCANEIPEEYLPETEEYLDAEPGEWDEYVQKLHPPTHPRLSYHMVYCRDSTSNNTTIRWDGLPQHEAKAGNYSLCMAR